LAVSLDGFRDAELVLVHMLSDILTDWLSACPVKLNLQIPESSYIWLMSMDFELVRPSKILRRPVSMHLASNAYSHMILALNKQGMNNDNTVWK